MKGYIKIVNKGEIDVDALMLLGATSKRGDDSKIGYFGSGLKYALAVLLRNKIDFKIYAGDKEIKVTLGKKEFRGKTFDVIKVNGKFTSLTTEMGVDWEPWFAVREVYCNAIDEGEASMKVSETLGGEAGFTTVYIKNEYVLADLFENWNKFFSEKRTDVLAESEALNTRIFEGNKHELLVYRKGVRVHQADRKCLFHYDLGWIKINESRVVASQFEMMLGIPRVLGKMATPSMIAKIFDGYQDTFEKDLSWSSVNIFNNDWLEMIGGRKIVIDTVAGYFMEEMANSKCLLLPEDLAIALKDYFGTKVNVLGKTDKYESGFLMKATPEQEVAITEAKAFLAKGDIDVTYPIVVFHFSEESKLGEANSGTIRLSPKLFDMGKRNVVITMLEEFAHLQSGFGDKTRSFQDFLFHKWMTLLENKIGERL